MSKQASARHPGIPSSVWGTHINYKERNYPTKLVSDLYMHDVALGMHTQAHTQINKYIKCFLKNS